MTGWTGFGVVAGKADVSDCEIVDNAFGISVTRDVRMTGCTITGNTLEGAHVFRGEIIGTSIDGNGNGLYVLKKVRIYSSSMSGNEHSGFFAVKVRAESSTIAGNCTSGAEGCADAVGRRRPTFINTTCGTSYNDMTGSSWGLCSGD